ncbi:MAG TPA: HAD-IB family phosphatase [Candidatus Eisenbacteria bacterium]|nr:HAD-IB family phosphatase [Candidatus Eisenbacteria bacterium]
MTITPPGPAVRRPAPFAFLCDFDGTVSPTDIGAAFVHRFSGGLAETPEFLARWRAGEMGHRELTELQCRLLRVTEDEALAFAARFELDPWFAPFARERRAAGDAVCVVSEGFGFYVAAQLAHAGLAELPWRANRARFGDGGVQPSFPPLTEGCGRCGTCKGAEARRWRAAGFEVVLVGDGLSDRCGAREADRVLAKGGLEAWCRAEGIAAEPFADFADVARIARDWSAGRAPGQGAGSGAGDPAGAAASPR